MENILQNSKVLVTGGAGFIGSNLCETFLKQSNQVICLDNLSTGKHENISHLLSDTNFHFINGDIRNSDDCKLAVDGCDFVFHQAALGSVPRSIKDPITTTEVNIGGFVQMLYASAKAKVKRFVYAASSSTYGDHPDLPKVEHVIGKPLSPYAITKYANELFAENFSAIYNIETVGLRYFNVFGRNQDPFGAYAAVIPKFVAQLLKYESPVINGDGLHSRDFTYIDNVIHANQLAATTPTALVLERRKSYYKYDFEDKSLSAESKVFAEVFNVACGENISLLELVNVLKAELSIYDPSIAKVKINFGPERAGDIAHSLASIDKAGKLFEYRPIYSVNEGLKMAVKWYWNNKINVG